MRRALVAVVSTAIATTALLAAPPATATATDPAAPPGTAPAVEVVVDHLANPRQLSWDGRPGRRLLIAEAGSGGDACAPSSEPGAEAGSRQCTGLTGSVSAVHRPGRVTGSEPHRVVTGLLSVADPDGSAAVGPDGVDGDGAGALYIAETDVPDPAAAQAGLDQLGQLLVATGRGALGDAAVPFADVAAAEEEQNPDGAQVESNPYAVLHRGSTRDGTASVLVADAAANTVWEVTPDPAAPAGSPGYRIEPFFTSPTPVGDDVIPELVPTSLAEDAEGNVYVGGLGSLRPGRGVVTRLSPEGEVLDEWGGFTSVTGVAVTEDGSTLFVSQLFGTTPLLPPGDAPSDELPTSEGLPGDVVRVDVAAATATTIPVPFPAGLAVDRRGRVYVAAYSTSDADGTAAGPRGPALPAGQVWRFSDPGGDGGSPLPVSGTPFPPPDTGGLWQPLPVDVASGTGSADVCGTTVFFRPGDVQEVEWRVTREEDAVLLEFRGRATVDLVALDGRVLEEVEQAGGVSQRFADDGSLAFSIAAPDVGFQTPGEAEAFAAAGLPELFSFTSGVYAETIGADGAVDITGVPEEVTDLCAVLDATPRPAPAPGPADDGFTPVADDYYAPVEVEACGTVVTLSAGDVREVEQRTTEDGGGTLTEYRGALTTDVTTADGRSLDELDNSGAYSSAEAVDGSTTYVVNGPAVVVPFPEEEQAFADAGLPALARFTEGVLSDVVGADGGVRITSVPEHVEDLCDLL